MKQFSRLNFLSILTRSAVDNEYNGTESSSTSSNARSGVDLYTGEWGRDQIMHLLRRSLFGVTKADYDFFSTLTLSQSLDILLTPTPEPTPPVNAYNDHSYSDPRVPFGQSWITDVEDTTEVTDHKRMANVRGWWVGLMLGQDRSLTEKMTLFWHNHLAARIMSMRDARTGYTYIRPLRYHALGNVKSLIYDITVSPGMLQYLNGADNSYLSPNENYARELQELFTIGKGSKSHYVQSDIEAASRILTGWSTNGLKTVFRPELHDPHDKHFSAFYASKIILGQTGERGKDETRELLDMILSTRESAMHICRNVYRWFVHHDIDEDIEASVISPLADILIKSDYEIAPALRALFGSVHFYDTANRCNQIKNPVDHIVGAYRTFGTGRMDDLASQYQVWIAIYQQLDSTAMAPGDPPGVAGWPAYRVPPSYYQLWVNSHTLVNRFIITDRLLSDGGIASNILSPLRFDVLAFTSQFSDPSDIELLVEDSLWLLSPVPFATGQKDRLKKILLQDDADIDAWTSLWKNYSIYKNTAAEAELNARLRQYYSYIFRQGESHII